jgi:hypothetical protein
MMNPDHSDTQFESLVSSFLSMLGQDPTSASGVTGFEFETEAYSVAVCPIRAGTLMVQVSVAALQPAEAADAHLLMMLHRLNEEARTEHGWTATIDPENVLLLYTSLAIQEVDAQGLQATLGTGLERANLLSEMIAQVTPPAVEESEVPSDIQMLRI